MTVELSGASTTHRPADSERRFHAFLLDRLLALVLCALAVAFAVSHAGSLAAGAALVVAVGVAAWLAGAVMTGLSGASPGKRLTGLRVVDAADGRWIGLSRALLRHGILGALTLPTAGFGAAILAWSAAADPSGRRRGLHDRLARTIVLDVRRRAVPAETASAGSGPAAQLPQLVNLTALRLRAADGQDAVASADAPRRRAAHPAHDRKVDWRVAFDTGESFVVRGLALVGADPVPRPGEQVAHRVTLPGDDLALAGTHLQFDVTPEGSLVVMDRGSAAGTTLVRQGAVRPLPPGRATTLLDGDRLRFADREMVVRREA